MFNCFRVVQRKQGEVTTVCQQGGREAVFYSLVKYQAYKLLFE